MWAGGLMGLGWLYPSIFFDPRFRLPRDIDRHIYPCFAYIVEHVRLFHAFPRWIFTDQGGMWIEPLANNLLILLPHHFIGYVAGVFSPLSPNLIYKGSFLLLGWGIFLSGLYGFAKLRFGTRLRAALFVLAGASSSLLLSTLHQEQVLATIFYWPWIWILACKVGENIWLLPVLTSLLALSLNHHYPQLQVLYVVSLLWAFLVSQPTRMFRVARGWLASKEGRFAIFLSLLGLGISSSPVIYSYWNYADRLNSSFRAQESSIFAADFEQYTKLNEAQHSSLHPQNLLTYLGVRVSPKKINRLDALILFATVGVPLVVMALLFLPIPHAVFHGTILALLCFLSIGRYGPLPGFLWKAVPGMSFFRQWYHFLPFLNLHLLFILFEVGCFFPWEKRIGRVRFSFCMVGLLGVLGGVISGQMDPLFAVAPFLLVILYSLRLSSSQKQRLLSVGLLLIVGFGNVRWTFSALDKYQRELVYQPPPQTPRDIDQLEKLYQPKLIGINGLDSQTAAAVIKSGLVQWRGADQRRFAVRPGQLSVLPQAGGLEIRWTDLPAEAVGVELIQYNDGKWNYSVDEGKSQPVMKGDFVFVPLSPEASVVRLEHESFWNYLIWAMWLPLGLGLVILIWVRWSLSLSWVIPTASPQSS